MIYSKRLIEVDLPIRRISAHARREKDMRRGHVPLLHIWPATRPPAACRAVICAMLWPDPADDSCPADFRKEARRQMLKWISHDQQQFLSEESRSRFEKARKHPQIFNDNEELRGALLDFIADFANWDNSTNAAFLETSRTLTQAAHEGLGGEKGTKPLLFDPFSGGGAIPLEALRVGADSFASDLNPIAILIEKTVLELVPKYGERLLPVIQNEVQKISEALKTKLSDFYETSAKTTSTAYIWARTIVCEGPSCGCKVPLIRSQLLVRKEGRYTGIEFTHKPKSNTLQISISQSKSPAAFKIGTARRGGATCPACGYTTPPSSVRKQLIKQKGGAAEATLLAVVELRDKNKGRFYRLPNTQDTEALFRARKRFEELNHQRRNGLTVIPDEKLNVMSGVFNAPIYGHNTWGTLFTPRQAVYLATCVSLIRESAERLQREQSKDFADAVVTCLALILDKMADMNSALCGWQAHAEIPAHTFARWALPMVWDFAETNPLAESSGSPESSLKRTLDGLSKLIEGKYAPGTVRQCSATNLPLPDDSASLFVTDPPYYNAVPYADLSDYFYVWARRIFTNDHEGTFSSPETPKKDEICEMAGWDPARYPNKDANWFEREMRKAMEEGRRVLAPSGLGLVVFAHKSTRGWEAHLQALIDAGWIVTASWPIDTEMASRMRAMNSAVLASSVHLVCRPRENPDGSVRGHEVGDWRDVLAELPKRIHDWMPRLAAEGVVGADAIFACLGPALEIYSRYSRVEKSNGEAVLLREYLEHVWAAVSKEALNMIFSGADATGFEEDARLTAMWLWTLKTGDTNGANGDGEAEAEGDDEESGGKKSKSSGFTLEFDAARKIAQGLGAHLESLTSLVAVEGETARLLPVAERAHALFGKDEGKVVSARRKREPQMDLFKALQSGKEGESSFGEAKVEQVGHTVLDRIHQSMILFAAGRGEALKRFLSDDGAGRDTRFWTLAQALSALYPAGMEEKRWVDGVLARKKGLGF